MEQVSAETGMTLIEIILVLAIVSIVSAAAVPTYKSIVTSSRRHIAKTQMINLHLQQQSHFINHNVFASQKELVMPDSKYYKFEVAAQSNSGFTIRAVANERQKVGTHCDTLTLDSELKRSPGSCW